MRDIHNRQTGRGFLVMLITWVLAVILGWLIFYKGLGGFYDVNTVHYEGFLRQHVLLVPLFLSYLAQAAFLVFVLHWLEEVSTFGRGFVVGAVLFLLVNAGLDFYLYSMFNMINGAVVLVDILVQGIYGGILGGVAGWLLGLGPKPKDPRTIKNAE
ncbi:MAG: hypothetical protein ACM3N9_06425 [Syntrophothermus sp.]